MSNYWLMGIGINQYQHLQTLGYAREDAQAVWNFLVGKASFMPDRCLLLTDSSPAIEGRSTYPNRENIQYWLDWLCDEAMQPGDRLWLFFSGQGAKADGQDYLMPIDGSPSDVAGTGISMRSILESLKASRSATQLVLLDINRSAETPTATQIGSQTVELARELEIPTVLSCQPNQSSHEASDLQHGLFTAALLEGLRTEQAGTSLATLKRYLSVRLPELCELHWRPRQEAVVVVHPPGKSHQVILPQQPVTVGDGYYANNDQRNNAAAEVGVGVNSSPVAVVTPPQTQPVADLGGIENPFDGNLDDIEPRYNSDRQDKRSPVVASMPTNGHSQPRKNVSGPLEDDDDNDGAFWQNLLLWGGGLLLLVLLLMSVFGGPWRQQTARQPGKTDPAKAGKPAQVVNKPKTKEQINQERLDKAKILLQNNQVARYSQAIALAGQVKRGEPLYNEAQDSVQRWSQMILDTAEGRAKLGDYTGAVAAAKLLPKDPQPIYSEGQKLIKQLEPIAKKQQVNRTLLATAKGTVRADQGSSYNKAIGIAGQIKPGEPYYAQAQKSIGQWSQGILNLAQKRAEQKNFTAAIQTASLVPANTPASAKAKQAIAQWKKQPKK